MRFDWTREEVALVIRYTRNWIHYGFFGYVCLCVFIGAVKGVMGG